MYMNDGTGYFSDATESWLPQQTEVCDGIALGDVDGDEDIDIFLACDGYLQNHLLINYLNTVDIEIETIQPPDEFVLLQNYPNPVNPITTIRYNLPEASNIKLVIYDILGRDVETFVEWRQEAGKHSVKLDATGMASGIYFYRIEAISPGDVRSFSQTRKMVLLR